MLKEKRNHILDYLGISTSVLCAIHCLLPPILLSFTAVGSLPFLENEYLELVILASAGVFAAWSLIPSVKIHHHYGPLGIASLGFTLIISAHFLHSTFIEIGMLLAGGILLSSAHFWNWKLKDSCDYKISSLS